MDLDRITHPLRLAKGSHQPGSGKGCAMNAISYINGDTRITDFPPCSARPLALMVQACNDVLAGPDGYLTPENSVLALDLGWQTVGTADVTNAVTHAWVAELLGNQSWGVIRYAKLNTVKMISDIAELHRQAAAGAQVPPTAWDNADRAARDAARSINRAQNPAGLWALQTAYHSIDLITDPRTALDILARDAVRTHGLASGGTPASRILELARHAIDTWRHLGAFDQSAEGTRQQRPISGGVGRAAENRPTQRNGWPIAA